MKTVYLNEDNTIREIIPEYALPPEKWYSEAFARRCVEVQDDVEQGWRYNPETGQATPDTRPPEPELTPQYAAAMRAYAATSTAIPDTYALDMPDLFPTWAVVLADGEELPAGRILNDVGQLYRVVQAVTPQEEMPPHDDGMLAIYRPIDREHAGTVDDPIPWVYGMDCYAGKHYSYNGKVYKVAEGGDMIPCTWAPDTPDMWQWVEV